MSLLKTTYFTNLTEQEIQALQKGELIEKMVVRDELTDGNIEEVWIEIKPTKIMEKIKRGDKLSDKPYIWKQMLDGMFAVKVDYTDDQGNQLYAVFNQSHVATGEHLTLPEVILRSRN